MDLQQVLLSPNEHPSVVDGMAQPCRVTAQVPENCIAVLDASHRDHGNNGLDFVVDLKGEISRARNSKVTKILAPVIPNINPKNNTVSFRHDLDGGTATTFTLDYGYYNQVSFVNELKSKMDAASVGLPDTWTIVYNSVTHVISITSAGGNNWYFVDTSSFILRGGNVHGFVGYPAATALTVDVQYSSSVSFVYTRYITIHSQALSRYVRTQSRNSTGDLSLIAAISVVEDMNAAQFDTSGVFAGNTITEITTDDAPKNAFSLKHGVLRFIDIQIKDEFGDPLYDSINISPSGVNSFNAVVWLSLEV